MAVGQSPAAKALLPWFLRSTACDMVRVAVLSTTAGIRCWIRGAVMKTFEGRFRSCRVTGWCLAAVVKLGDCRRMFLKGVRGRCASWGKRWRCQDRHEYFHAVGSYHRRGKPRDLESSTFKAATGLQAGLSGAVVTEITCQLINRTSVTTLPAPKVYW